MSIPLSPSLVLDLKAAVSILDAVDDASGLPSRPAADVIGNSITLTAVLGGIGISGNDLDINSASSGEGVLTSSSALDTYLIETQGDLSINEVGTGAAYTAFILGPARILNGNPTAGASNVSSGKTRLFAVGDIGSEDRALETTVGFLEGRSETGNVWITNTGALTVGGVSDAEGVEAYGTVTIVANSPVIMDENIHVFGAGEDIIVTSTDGAGNGDYFIVKSGVQVISDRFDNPAFGDDFTLEAGAELSLVKAFRFTVIMRCRSGLPTHIVIEGSMTAPELYIWRWWDDVIDINPETLWAPPY